MNTAAVKRIQKELASYQKENPGFELAFLQENEIGKWVITFDGAKETLYEGETHKLLFEFPNDSPLSAPTVKFMTPIIHHHIYSNGDICLSILHDDWTPAYSVKSIVLSIISMLSSATEEEKKRPDNDYAFTRASKYLKTTNWDFDDEKC